MGVLNVTPDSFSDGGEFFSAESAIAHGHQMIADGADIIDIGGESTRPGAEPVAAAEEMRRALPVIEALARENVLLSIDTMKAEVADAALERGAHIVNDVSGGTSDSAMGRVVAQRAAAFIVMHMQGNPRTMQLAPRYENVVREIGDFFRQQQARLIDCGIDPMALAFDPGIGFGKTLEHNLTLLRRLHDLRVAGRPLVVGVSHKSFLGKVVGTNGSADDRLAPTVAMTSWLRARGADVLRVHEVKENLQAMRVADTLREPQHA